MIAPNTLLQNRYMVLSQVGQGGMGAVYIATDQRFGSTVALKETFFMDASMRKAFEREARLLNHLRHAALPKVIDHFTEDEGQFLVMEFIPGEDLAEMLKQRGTAFPVPQVLDWADQLLDALDYLHTQEPPVIHRDIKPQNLKLTTRGHIVLLDFGLAKGAPAQLSRVTNTGSIFGYSRSYAPIEQIQGAGTDVRSDLYSLGATLYHLITGLTPPDALTRATAVLNHQADPLQLANEVNPQVPRPIAEAIHKAMAQSAGQRPQTAEEMRKEMREAALRAERASVSASAAQPTVVNELSEQDTQILGAYEPARKTEQGAAQTERMRASEVAPLLAEPTVKPSPAAATSIDSGAELTAVDESGSAVTKVHEQQALYAQRPTSRRTLLMAAAVVLMVFAIGTAYFAMRRYGKQNDSQTTQTEPQPTQSAAPSSPTPAQTQTESAATEPSTESTQASANASDATQNRAAGHTQEHRAQTHAEAPQTAPPPIDPKTGAATAPHPQPPPPGQPPPNIPPQNDPGYWDARRQAAEQRRQEMERRRMLRMERQIIQEQMQQRRRMRRP